MFYHKLNFIVRDANKKYWSFWAHRLTLDFSLSSFSIFFFIHVAVSGIFALCVSTLLSTLKTLIFSQLKERVRSVCNYFNRVGKVYENNDRFLRSLIFWYVVSTSNMDNLSFHEAALYNSIKLQLILRLCHFYSTFLRFSLTSKSAAFLW